MRWKRPRRNNLHLFKGGDILPSHVASIRKRRGQGSRNNRRRNGGSIFESRRKSSITRGEKRGNSIEGER